MCLKATKGSFKTLPESLKEIRVGVLGACRGSLGPDWSNFLWQRGKEEHRDIERGNDQRVRARRQRVWMSDQTENGDCKEVRARQAQTVQRLRESKERRQVLRCQSSDSLTPTKSNQERRQVTRQPSSGSLPVWLLPIGYGTVKPHSSHCGCHIWSALNENRPLPPVSFVVFLLSCGIVGQSGAVSSPHAGDVF